MLGYAGWYWGLECMECRNFMFYMPMSHLLLMGPVIFIYIKSLLNPSFRFNKKEWIHFLPGLLYIVWNLIVAIVDRVIKNEYYLMDGENDPDFATWYTTLGLISLLVYLLGSFRYYQRYRAFIVQELSFADMLQFKWVQNFLIACFIYFFATIFLDILRLIGLDIQYTDTWWYYLLFAFIFYYIAITGYAHSIESKKKFELDFLRYQMPLHLAAPTVAEEDVDYEIVGEQVPRAEISESEIPAIWKLKVLEAIEGQYMYRDPELTLTDLANALGTNASLLSKIINRSFGKNFNDFINHYRVTEVKNKLANPANANLTIMSIAYDAGFNSKATFNRAFKKHTGQNPKTYQIKD